MLYYNYDKHQLLIVDQEGPEVILYQFDTRIKLIDQKKLEALEVQEILRSEEWRLI